MNPSKQQLSLFLDQEIPDFSDRPCDLCSSENQVVCILFLFANETIRRFANLCINCRSNPAIIGD